MVGWLNALKNIWMVLFGCCVQNKNKTGTLLFLISSRCLHTLQNARLNLCTVVSKSVQFAFVFCEISASWHVLWTGHFSRVDCHESQLVTFLFFLFYQSRCSHTLTVVQYILHIQLQLESWALWNCKPPTAWGVASPLRTAPRPLYMISKGSSCFHTTSTDLCETSC